VIKNDCLNKFRTRNCLGLTYLSLSGSFQAGNYLRGTCKLDASRVMIYSDSLSLGVGISLSMTVPLSVRQRHAESNHKV
jgi:hypothetical protein